MPGPYSDQGLATVSPAPGPDSDRRRREPVHPRGLAGGHRWNHVGDADGWNGWLVNPFQGGAGARAKLFHVAAPGGGVTRALHPLVPGEQTNNSFAA